MRVLLDQLVVGMMTRWLCKGRGRGLHSICELWFKQIAFYFFFFDILGCFPWRFEWLIPHIRWYLDSPALFAFLD